MKNYDFNKAKQLIEENKDSLYSASLGMHEDWFWTAETVWRDNKFVQELNDDSRIGGLQGSNWATPVLQLQFNDETDKMIACFVDDGEPQGNSFGFGFGVLSGPVQDSITPISED